MSHSRTAARVRAAKEQHPERYCAAKDCLWRTDDTFCPRHAAVCVSCGQHGGEFANTTRGWQCDACVAHPEDPAPEVIARQEQQDWEESR